MQSQQGAVQHDTPKCLSCGTVTQWKIEPVLKPINWIIALGLLVFFGAGLVYLVVVALIRSNPNNRAKICPRCGARNMWTFLY